MIFHSWRIRQDLNQYPAGSKFYFDGKIEYPDGYVWYPMDHPERMKKMEKVKEALNKKPNLFNRLYYKIRKLL